MLLTNIFNYFTGLVSREDGQGMVEYILLVGLIALAVVAVLLLLGPAIAAKFTEVINAL
ncbi:MAG: hypothetical protein WBA54_06645 [Acidaminobacteraceae bacterium]